MRNKIPEQDIQAKVDRLALSLRTKRSNWLRDQKGWRDSWVADKDSNTTTEDGDVRVNQVVGSLRSSRGVPRASDGNCGLEACPW